MIKSFLILTLSLVLSYGAYAQEGIKWLSWEEALELHSETEKKFFVDIYTDWCLWCSKMEKSTLSDPKIVDYINENYYPIHFNAEDKQELIFDNKLYKPIKSFGKRATHELAIEIMNGNIGYPTIVFIDENLKVIQPIQGFQDVKTLEMIMTFFAGNYYKSMHWKAFVSSYEANKASDSKAIKPSDIQPAVQTVGGGRS